MEAAYAAGGGGKGADKSKERRGGAYLQAPHNPDHPRTSWTHRVPRPY
jgi:hypothetical protein